MSELTLHEEIEGLLNDYEAFMPVYRNFITQFQTADADTALDLGEKYTEAAARMQQYQGRIGELYPSFTAEQMERWQKMGQQ